MTYDFNKMIQRIKEKKKELDLTNKELSDSSGVPFGTLNKILGSETKDPSISNIVKIAIALGVSTEYLLYGSTRPEKSEVFTPSEKTHIKKYRTLDEYGRRTVDVVLDIEHERCLSGEHGIRGKVFELPLSLLPVSAGTGEFLSDEMTSVIEIPDTPFNRTADYVVQVSGDSMEPEYEDDDLLLVRKQPQVYEGEIGIFVLNGKGYVKKFGGDRLISLNDDYEDIMLHEYDRIDCFGKVIGKV